MWNRSGANRGLSLPPNRVDVMRIDVIALSPGLKRQTLLTTAAPTWYYTILYYTIIRTKQMWPPACVASGLSMRRFCELQRGNANFCKPKRVLRTVSGYLLAIAGGDGLGGRRTYAKGRASRKDSAKSQGVKRTSANAETLAKQSASPFRFALI